MISVCIATYNGEKYFREQLASILPQLDENDEIIISDDDSGDATLELATEFGDKRVKVFRNPGARGYTRNFENALKNASGDLILLSDQDDVWASNKVSRILKTFEQNSEVTLIVTNASLIDKDGALLAGSFQPAGPFRGGIISTLIKNRYHGCTMAFRRQVLEAALPFPPCIPMHDSWIGLVNTFAGKAMYLDENLVFYRRHDQAVTGRVRQSWRKRVAQRWLLLKHLVCRRFELAARRNQRVALAGPN